MKSTEEIKIPQAPLSLIIGQDEAVRIARIATRQKRNLLMVGPPGVGKSMIAWAISTLLPKPSEEISVLHNPECPERPTCEARTREQISADDKFFKVTGRPVDPRDIPFTIAEKLGFRCRRCTNLSSSSLQLCPKCGYDKYRVPQSPFDDLVLSVDTGRKEKSVQTTLRNRFTGQEEVFMFESEGGMRARVYNSADLSKMQEMSARKPRKVIVPLERNTFVQATGASETEFLGDVRHDPYGGHPEIGTHPYLRVVPGAMHEAHEGVLFVDELSSLGHLQKSLLTAMQEKRFPISGKNPSSTGSSVRVDNVPCSFVLVSAVNINDLEGIMPPLRSRILGDGYEVLLNTHMPDTEENRLKLLQFAAQEITKDGRIPHADMEACEALLSEARARAKAIDGAHASLTLRLRNLSGIIKLAGDMAVFEGSPLIGKAHIKAASEKSKSVEEQLQEKYGSLFKAGISDYSLKKAEGRSSEIA